MELMGNLVRVLCNDSDETSRIRGRSLDHASDRSASYDAGMRGLGVRGPLGEGGGHVGHRGRSVASFAICVSGYLSGAG